MDKRHKLSDENHDSNIPSQFCKHKLSLSLSLSLSPHFFKKRNIIFNPVSDASLNAKGPNLIQQPALTQNKCHLYSSLMKNSAAKHLLAATQRTAQSNLILPE